MSIVVSVCLDKNVDSIARYFSFSLTSFLYTVYKNTIHEIIHAGDDSMAEVKAPMPGIICEIKVKPGDTIIEEQEVLTLEAMKMEMPIAATAAGTIKAVHCKKGDAVQGGDTLVEIE